jgi:hypothetical protein
MIHHLHHHQSRRIHQSRWSHQSRRSHRSRMSHQSRRSHQMILQRRLQLGKRIHIHQSRSQMSFRHHIRLRLGWRDRRCNRFRLHQMSLHRHRCGLRFWLIRLPRFTWLRLKRRFSWIISWNFLHMSLRHLLIRLSYLQERLRNQLRRLLRQIIFLIIKLSWLGWLRSSWSRLRCRFPSRRFHLPSQKFIRIRRPGLRSGWRRLRIRRLRFIPLIRSISLRFRQQRYWRWRSLIGSGWSQSGFFRIFISSSFRWI